VVPPGWGDESGGEVLEYALVAGLIVVAAVAAIRLLGVRVAWGWSYIRDKL
jgi:Flp pilus assembly pilin Flp